MRGIHHCTALCSADLHSWSPYLDIINGRRSGVWKPPIQCVVASLVMGLRVNQSCTGALHLAGFRQLAVFSVQCLIGHHCGDAFGAFSCAAVICLLDALYPALHTASVLGGKVPLLFPEGERWPCLPYACAMKPDNLPEAVLVSHWFYTADSTLLLCQSKAIEANQSRCRMVWLLSEVCNQITPSYLAIALAAALCVCVQSAVRGVLGSLVCRMECMCKPGRRSYGHVALHQAQSSERDNCPDKLASKES